MEIGQNLAKTLTIGIIFGAPATLVALAFALGYPDQSFNILVGWLVLLLLSGGFEVELDKS